MKILVECNTDKYLITKIVQKLGFSRKLIRHEANKPKVIDLLRKSDGRIGVIDEDPNSSQPRDMTNYKEVEKHEDIKILERIDNKRKTIFVICPRMEEWLLKRANKNKISTDSFNPKNDPNTLHKINIDKNINYRNFIDRLIEVDDEINTLKMCISGILKENN
jgi:hypothetical protein